MRALGCVNSHPAARGSQKAGFTQPRVHSLAHPCTCKKTIANAGIIIKGHPTDDS